MQALLWVEFIAEGDGDVVLCCDSHYAMGIAEELIEPSKNLEMAQRLQTLLKQVGGGY